MNLLQIQEPKTLAATQKAPKNPSIAVGIDLGTTYSLVAESIQGNVTIFEDKYGQNKIPSVVSIDKDHVLYSGNHALRNRGKADVCLVSSIKRLMGKHAGEKVNVPHLDKFILGSDITKLKLHNRFFTPVELSSEILKELKNIAEKKLNADVIKAVITVPAYFDEMQRQATKQAAALANIEVLRIINEPTSAALAYGLNHGSEGVYVIYDFGGGTFDVSVLQMSKGVFKVLATGGDANLGGDDIDVLLAKYLTTKSPNPEAFDFREFIVRARAAKEDLCKKETTEVNVSDPNKTLTLTRNELNNIITKLIDDTLKITKRVILDSKVPENTILGIIMVGGSTRLPLIKEKFSRSFPNINIYSDIDPDEIVAIGAAIQAENLTSGSNNLLLDVTPLSLGIELLGGITEKIIHRNSTIPISVSKEFTTYQDGQTGIKLHIVQGEREMAKDCRSLAFLEINNIPPRKAGEAKIKVTFTIDADGLLTVDAEGENFEHSDRVEAMLNYDLNESKIENMLRDAIKNSQNDMEEKLLVESKLSAEALLKQISHALQEDIDLISLEEKKRIENTINKLNRLLEINDTQTTENKEYRHSINDAVDTLEKVSTRFIESKIDRHLNKALRGVSIKDTGNITTNT